MADREGYLAENEERTQPARRLPATLGAAAGAAAQSPRVAWWVPVAMAFLLGVVLLLPISAPGIWDPPELEVADFGRRIAVNLFGAEELRLGHAVNDVPTRRELGRGELPFTSVALGFTLFGLSDWAGRLPMALWSWLGLLATYALVARLADRSAACLSTLVLCFTPLYFVHARSMLGDAVTMAAIATAVAGLGVGALDFRLSRGKRAAWLLLGALGLYAGFWCRGMLLGVSVPLLAVSLTWLQVGRRAPRGGSTLLALVLLAGAVSSLLAGLWALAAAASGGTYSILVGCAPSHAAFPPSHAAVLQHLGHALFPVSALLPFAVGLLFSAPRITHDSGKTEYGLRLLVANSLICAIAAYALVAPYAGVLPFGAVFACAIAVGLMLRDMTRRCTSSRALAMGVAAVAAMLLNDFRTRPATSFAAYAVYDSDFPSSMLGYHTGIWGVGTACFVSVFFFSYIESSAVQSQAKDWRQDYGSYLRALRAAFDGNLWFGIVGSSMVLGLWGLSVALSEYVLHLAVFEDMWSVTRAVALHAWWMVPTLVFIVPLVSMWVRDAVRWLSQLAASPDQSRLLRRIASRTGLSATALVVFGLVLSLGYYPALAADLAPKQVFSSYERLAGPREPLALLGMAGSSAAYYTDRPIHWLETAQAAARWLSDDRQRRFLVVRARDLPEINSLYRKHTRPPMNVPVLDASSSEILLVSNQARNGKSNNPFDDWIVSRRPRVQRMVSANLNDQLEVVGWELRDAKGALTDTLLPGRAYQLALIYEVVNQLETEYQTFVHIDGHGRRYNGDHPTLQGKYPLVLLNRGDIFVDEHTVVLEPNFTPGDYSLYFGMFNGSRRLSVTRGRHVDDRIMGGLLKVR